MHFIKHVLHPQPSLPSILYVFTELHKTHTVFGPFKMKNFTHVKIAHQSKCDVLSLCKPLFPRVIWVVCIATYRSTKRKTDDKEDDGDAEDDESFVGPQGGVLVHDPRQHRLQHGKLQGHPKVMRVKPKVIRGHVQYLYGHLNVNIKI